MYMPQGASMRNRPRPVGRGAGKAKSRVSVGLGLVERLGVGPQADLVEHHRRHRDGVAATAGPFGCQLLAGFGDLVELEA